MFVSDIVKEVSKQFLVHERDILGPYRFDFVVRARFALYKVLHLRGMRLQAIARVTKRHHTSVMNGLVRADTLMENDPSFRDKVEQIASLTSDYLKV